MAARKPAEPETFDAKTEKLLRKAGKLATPITVESRREAWLVKNLWWWRWLDEKTTPSAAVRRNRLKKFGIGQLGVAFLGLCMKQRMTVPEFTYELLMRVRFPALHPVPFGLLPIPVKRSLNARFDDRTAALFRGHNLPGTLRCTLKFDLWQGKAANIRKFVEDFLKPESERFGINVKPIEGRRNRGLSWRVVELLDLRRLEIRPLNASERSQVSQNLDKLRSKWGPGRGEKAACSVSSPRSSEAQTT